MRRVQIQVPDEQFTRLQERAASTGESMASVVRRALAAQDAADERRRRIEVALAAIHHADYRSGLHDVSENHDEYIAQAIEERIGRR